MRWLELIKYLLDGYINWYASWKPVFDREKAEEELKKNPPVDTPYTVVNDGERR